MRRGWFPNLNDVEEALRKIILMMSVSLDGAIEGPHRELDWHIVDDELHGHFNKQLSAMGAFLNGRVTYELVAGFWPTADTEPPSTKPLVTDLWGHSVQAAEIAWVGVVAASETQI